MQDDDLTLFQTVAHRLARKWIYFEARTLARRNRGFRLISVSHDLMPTRLGRRLGFPHLSDAYQGSAQVWNSLRTGEPVTEGKHLEWLERIWLAAIDVEPAPPRYERRKQIAAPHRNRL